MFYYYGAKHMLARRYQRPTHRLVVEPFAGAAGYSVHHLTRGNIDHAILVEKDPRVAELWRRLLAMTPQEVRALKPPEPGEWTDDFLWMTVAASNALARSTGYSFSERATGSARGMRARIAAVLPMVKDRVTVIDGDYTRAPDITATWFVDPPYQVPADANHSSSRGNGYAAGCDSRAMDFPALGTWCQSRQGQVIVCEYEGADWLPFVPLTKGWNSVGSERVNEVVWNSQHDADRLFDPYAPEAVS